MERDYQYGQNQLMVLASVIILAPALRLFPAASAATAGHAAWVSAFVALPPLLLFLLFICRVMNGRNEGEGLAELMLRRTGPALGRLFLLITALWLLLYGGFSLRAGANRLITTVYPTSSPVFFSVSICLLGLLASLGSFRSIARFAKLTAPAVFGILFLVLLFSLFTIDPTNLMTVTAYELPKIALGALPAVDVVAFVLYGVCFSEGMTKKISSRYRYFSLWTAAMLLLLFLLCLTIIGNFGAELTARLTRPFFSLARNLVFSGNVERIEALVVSLWVFPDFLLFSVVLSAAARCLRLIFGYPTEYRGERLFDFSGGRYMIWLCAGVSLTCAVFLGQTPDALLRWSLEIIPALNMSYAFGFLPFVFFVGAIIKHAARG